MSNRAVTSRPWFDALAAGSRLNESFIVLEFRCKRLGEGKTALSKKSQHLYTPSSLRWPSWLPERHPKMNTEYLRLTAECGLAMRRPLENHIRLAQTSKALVDGFVQKPLSSIAELCCVLDFAGNQHYPPSWVEARTSLGQVVNGSATPVGASQ